MLWRKKESPDLVTEGPDGSAILYLIRHEPWSSSAAELEAIGETLTRYVQYVIDGDLGREHPALAGRPWRIAIDSYAGRPNDEAMRALRATGEEIGAYGGELVFRELRASAAGNGQPTTVAVLRLRTRAEPAGAPIGLHEAIDDAVAGTVAELSSALPRMSDDVVVERYAHIGHIFGHVFEVCERVGAERVGDIPPGADRELADALITEEVELSVRIVTTITDDVRARIKARGLELDRECPTVEQHVIGRAAADPRTRPA